MRDLLKHLAEAHMYGLAWKQMTSLHNCLGPMLADDAEPPQSRKITLRPKV